MRTIVFTSFLLLTSCASIDPCYGPWGTQGLQEFGCPDHAPPVPPQFCPPNIPKEDRTEEERGCDAS